MIRQIYTIRVTSDYVRSLKDVRRELARMWPSGYGLLSIEELVIRDTKTGGSESNKHALQSSNRKS